MSDIEPRDPVARLRHEVSQPLSVLLAEVQLMLMEADSLDPGMTARLREMERQILRAREILKREK